MDLFLGGVTTYAGLRDALVEHGDFGRTGMGRLRDLHNALRLGAKVREEISERLHDHGIGHLPPALPGNQDAEVRLYLKNTPVGELITAVLEPTRRGDELLVGAVSGRGDDAEKLRMIAEIVGGR